MRDKVGQYSYEIHGRAFRIYICTLVTATGSQALPVYEEPFFYNEEEARKRVYELNGWKYKPKDAKT